MQQVDYPPFGKDGARAQMGEKKGELILAVLLLFLCSILNVSLKKKVVLLWGPYSEFPYYMPKSNSSERT